MNRAHPAIRKVHEELSQLSREIEALKEAYLAGSIGFDEYRKRRAELEIMYERLAEESLRKHTRSKK